MATTIDGEHFDMLMAELDQVMREMIADAGRDPARWRRGRPGRWTVGQHFEHVALTLAVTADAFEVRLPQVLEGRLGPAPRRGPLQWMWVALVAKRGVLPRGIRTPRRFEAGPDPERAATLDWVRREVERHRAMGRRLTAVERDRLWIRNPF